MTRDLVVATWNVLHRVHGVNWGEPAITAHPDEGVRVAAIARRVQALGADLACLQEVSGDQLAALDEPRLAHGYPRVPRYTRGSPRDPTPADAAEYLVAVGGDARPIHAETFASDRGKGFQAVEIGGFTIVNTHLSYGSKHASQCARIVAWLADRACAVVGDFNADRETSERHFGAGFSAAALSGELATRPGTAPGDEPQMIDQILVRGCTIVEAWVESGGGLSDHNPVVARLRPR